MEKFLVSVFALALVIGLSGDRFRKYRPVETYRAGQGITITPTYSPGHDICEVSIEKRHYSDGKVDLDAVMSKEQILSIFDELALPDERGGPKWKLPAGSEITEVDLGILETTIPYENVTLAMYGKSDKQSEQKYLSAIISWNTLGCNSK
jgi:hypothetical protein